MFKYILPLAFIALPLQAEDNSWDYFKNVTVINLNAQARETVTQDRLKTTLTINKEAKTPEEVQAYINTKMAAALKVANAQKSIKTQTGHYNVRKQIPYDQKMTLEERERRATWVGSQSIVLDSDNKDALLKVAGQLQKDAFTMNGLNYYLSREKSEQYSDRLNEEALEAIKTRATKLAKQLGMPHVHFANVNFSDHMPVPIRQEKMMMARAMSADMAEMPAPSAQEGESDITANVSVEVHLSR